MSVCARVLIVFLTTCAPKVIQTFIVFFCFCFVFIFYLLLFFFNQRLLVKYGLEVKERDSMLAPSLLAFSHFSFVSLTGSE